MPDLALPNAWHHPPAEFSLAPFWFWNDHLDEAELVRQMDEFQAHGVDAFVIHPRVGLPRSMGWMSTPLLAKIRFAIEQAKSRGMWVILYDEGMYPSGSSSGQVVAENPAYQCRGLVRINLDTAQPDSVEQGVIIGADGQPLLSENQTLLATVPHKGHRYAIVDRPIDAVIRGLHFIDERAVDPRTGETQEDTPPAADLLNPEAVKCFIHLVYDRYYQEFGKYFGNTIQAIFTDEPMLLGRPREKYVLPGTSDILSHVNAFLGYDFTPYLPALWDPDSPQKIRDDYERAVESRLETTYYSALYDWCESYGIALTGHPAEPDATRHLRYFHIPGQDIVWRQIEADKPTALEGRQSTQAKAASSMMLHTQRRRNANEFCGAYGHDLIFDEMRWLAYWLLVRGCNLLIPHAFYYSVRGPRKDERPPDVGLHSSWWNDDFTAFASACRRLCWLNTDSEHVCQVAILGEHHHLPWRAAKVCFENQIDFNYLDIEDLINTTTVEDKAIHIGNQRYVALIVDGELGGGYRNQLDALKGKLAVIQWNDDTPACLSELQQNITTELRFDPPCENIRLRHVRKYDRDWYILFNESTVTQSFRIRKSEVGQPFLLDPYTGSADQLSDSELVLPGGDVRVLMV